MNDATQKTSISDELGANIPYLRRFARAMTGSQTSGDTFAAAALEAILVDRSVLDGVGTKTGLFKVLYGIWASAGAPVEEGESGPRAKAQRHLSSLTNNSREALLLHTIEGFSHGEIAKIIGVDEAEADELIQIAHREMADSTSGSVMIIEDEAIIAMDIESIVAEMGHRVTGIARTRDEAVKLGKADVPDLILRWSVGGQSEGCSLARVRGDPRKSLSMEGESDYLSGRRRKSFRVMKCRQSSGTMGQAD